MLLRRNTGATWQIEINVDGYVHDGCACGPVAVPVWATTGISLLNAYFLDMGHRCVTNGFVHVFPSVGRAM